MSLSQDWHPKGPVKVSCHAYSGKDGTDPSKCWVVLEAIDMRFAIHNQDGESLNALSNALLRESAKQSVREARLAIVQPVSGIGN